MSAQAIGELVQNVLARCVAAMWLHDELAAIGSADGRKKAIMRARQRGQISPELAADFIAAYQLETA